MHFDKSVKSKLQKPEKVALQNALIRFDKSHKIKVKKKLVKNVEKEEDDEAEYGKNEEDLDVDIGNAEEEVKKLKDLVES